MDDLEAPLKNRKPPYISYATKNVPMTCVLCFLLEVIGRMIVKREANLEPTHC
jgi:hypothetical protein